MYEYIAVNFFKSLINSSQLNKQLKVTLQYIIIFLVLTFVKTCFSQSSKDYYIEKKLYTYSDGLPSRSVLSSIQDANGYIWFITKNGLCRFDGKKFKVVSQKTHGLYSNSISTIISDNRGAIIISYYSSKSMQTLNHIHFDVLDINTLKIKTLKEHYPKIPFNETEISLIEPNLNNNVVFYTKPFFNLNIHSILKSTAWELYDNGNFVRKNIKVNKVIKFKNDSAIIQSCTKSTDLNEQDVYLLNDSGIVFNNYESLSVLYKINLGTYLIKYKNGKKSRFFLIIQASEIIEINPDTKEFPEFVFDDNIQYINNNYHDNTGVVFTKGKMLYVYNKQKMLINLIDSVSDESIKSAKIVRAFRDKIGNYWISSSEGVIKINIKPKKFKNLFDFTELPKGLNNSARGIYSNKDTLILATEGFVAVKIKNKTTLINNPYNYAIRGCNGKYWVGSVNGLFNIDFESNKLTPIIRSLQGEIWDIYPIDSTHLLLGCSSGISVFDIHKKSIKAVDAGKFNNPILVYKLFKHTSNEVLAVASNGIYTLNNEFEIIDCINADTKAVPNQLAFDEINDIHIDGNKLYWIATASNGLFCWDREKLALQQFGAEEGFLSQTLYKIEEDNYNNLWISTEFGLVKFNKLSKKAQVYTEKDGITHNEFNRISSFKNRDNILYFGGLNGVISFNPSDFVKSNEVADFPLVINAYTSYNYQTNTSEDRLDSLINMNKIVLDNEKNNFTLTVKLLDYENRDPLYAYQIEGLSREWIFINDGIIKVNNLPYGDFKLKIKAQSISGIWNKNEILLPITVIKPFYKTWWFYMIGLSIMILFVFVIVTIRVKSLEKINKRLDQLVEKRTMELESSLLEQISLLQEVHHRVKNNLQFISAMLKMQINAVKHEKDKAALKDASRRINAMALVHDMLYNKEKVEYISVKEYLTELISKLSELSSHDSGNVKFNVNIDDVKFDINNCVSIGMITSEIISNAIKYAFVGVEKPVIDITLKFNHTDNMVIYSIHDNGEGILIKNNASGIGLRLIDIFARQMEAEYESLNKNGLQYVFKIPYKST